MNKFMLIYLTPLVVALWALCPFTLYQIYLQENIYLFVFMCWLMIPAPIIATGALYIIWENRNA